MKTFTFCVFAHVILFKGGLGWIFTRVCKWRNRKLPGIILALIYSTWLQAKGRKAKSKAWAGGSNRIRSRKDAVSVEVGQKEKKKKKIYIYKRNSAKGLLNLLRLLVNVYVFFSFYFFAAVCAELQTEIETETGKQGCQVLVNVSWLIDDAMQEVRFHFL